MSIKKLPELLSPAGSKEAFLAAVDGGADAIYCGGTSFNARINAKNFTDDELSECIRLAHAYGIKVYMTLNTLVFDKEAEGILSAAESAVRMGMDAFIVADLGVAAMLKTHIPEAELHASTQMSVHNCEAGNTLQKLGFSRLVPARELSLADIKHLVENNPLEVEIFTHGALCVSHSGQCLFSSVVGGRSGNRGLCAQPCRLPYSCEQKNSKAPEYPLSLKDLSLATHVTDILECGVHSLKIEGRMKSPEYVRTVTGVWRKLLDEGRNATPDEIRRLSDTFSRGGFTDGYFSGRMGRHMLGIRTESDKLASLETQKFHKVTRKVPIDMSMTLCADTPSLLTLTHNGISVCVSGDSPSPAINAPTDEECVRRSLSKLGDTPFELRSLDVNIEEQIMMPISRLNDLRRQGVLALQNAICDVKPPIFTSILPDIPKKARQKQNVGLFLFPSQITEKARSFFDKTFLPLERYDGTADGFIMPPVILDSEKHSVIDMIDSAISAGATHAMVGNIGNLFLLNGKIPHIYGDFRFNITNNYTAAQLEKSGIESMILSPELTLPQMRDIKGDVASIVYGRLPLMTLEKCVIRDMYGCSACDKYISDRSQNIYAAPPRLKDRRGVTFPIIRAFDHRNIIYNSLPTCMSDKEDALISANITNRTFIFTTESEKEVDAVISAYKNHLPLSGQVRRI